MRAYERTSAFVARVRTLPPDKWPDFEAGLPDVERLERLPWFLDGEYMRGEYLQYVRHDPAGARAAWQRTRGYADQLLALCDKLPDDVHRDEAFFDAHVVLAALAVHDNDTAGALRHLDASLKPANGGKVVYGYNAVWDRAAGGLLKRGERESVARFLDRLSVVSEPWLSDRLKKDATDIRTGKMPGFYQRQVTPRKAAGT